MDAITNLILLFLVALLSATLLPSQSELWLAGLHYTGDYAPWLLVAVASCGNIIGAVVNWALGRYLLHFKDRKWFPADGKSMARATRIYNKWGVWTLLLAWVPFIGDPLTLIAGVFRANIWLFLLLVSISKISRYVVVMALIL